MQENLHSSSGQGHLDKDRRQMQHVLSCLKQCINNYYFI